MKKIVSGMGFVIHVFIAMVLFLYYQIIGPFVKLKPKPGKEKIIFVSGWFTYDFTFSLIKKRLENKGGSVYCPDFGLKLRSVEIYSEKLNNYVKENKLKNFSIVGFSLGGIIAWDYYNKYKPKVKKIIFVGTPFGGTSLAKLAFFSKSAKQMIPGNNFLKQIKPSSNKNTYSLILAKDKYVPSKAHVLKGSKQIVMKNIGHFNGEFSNELADEISDVIFS